MNKINDKPSDDWHITQLEPDKSPKEIAQELAVHFSSITNQTKDTEVVTMSSRIPQNNLFPQLMEATVAKKITAVSYTHLTLPTIYSV